MDENKTGSAYLLTEAERNVVQSLHTHILIAKAKAWDAHNDLAVAEREWTAGIGVIASSHGVGGGELTPDFSAIVKR